MYESFWLQFAVILTLFLPPQGSVAQMVPAGEGEEARDALLPIMLIIAGIAVSDFDSLPINRDITVPPLPKERKPPLGEIGPDDLPLDEQPQWQEQHLGIGFLTPKNLLDTYASEWLREVTLPLYNDLGAHVGWLFQGWWIKKKTSKNEQAETDHPIPISCMRETGYEFNSFIVYKLLDNGWFRFGLSKPCNGQGSVWAHSSHLTLGKRPLKIVRWEDHFMSGSISPLYFRRSDIAHALRAAPNTESPKLTRIIGDNYAIYPLRVFGEWMEVRIFIPSDYCTDRVWRGTKYRGWMRWRDNEIGPWLWYYPRGC